MTDILWRCHARGPDDVYAAPDYETALLWSDALNELNWNKGSGITMPDPKSYQDCTIKAVPAPWPHSPESHAEDLPKSMKGFALPSTMRRGPCQVCGETAELKCGPSRFGAETWACTDCWEPDQHGSRYSAESL